MDCLHGTPCRIPCCIRQSATHPDRHDARGRLQVGELRQRHLHDAEGEYLPGVYVRARAGMRVEAWAW